MSVSSADGRTGACRCAVPPPAKGGRRAIASPFAHCPICGGFVPRIGANEWGLMAAGERVGHLARAALLSLGVGLGAGFVHLVAALLQGREWRWQAGLGWFVAGVVVTALWRGSRLSEAIRRSRRRMGDPMYRAKLVEYELASPTRR